jgi:hypothetical protein
MLYEIPPSEELQRLFTTLKEARGEIDYVLIGGISPDDFTDSYTLHKEAATFSLEMLTHRSYNLRFTEKGPQSRKEAAKAKGTRILPAEFFQPGHIGIPFELSNILTSEEFETEHLKLDQNIFSRGEIGQYIRGYHYAFYYPPYNLQGLRDENGYSLEWLFSAMNHALFGDDNEALTIYAWSTDWADYFNQGHEWWGSFLWTVYSTQTKLMVGIAASAS